MSANLETILAAKRRRVAESRQSTDWRELEKKAEQHRPRGFARALREASRTGPAVIAELKRASPSRGVIRANLDISRAAAELASAGASALSVLTEEDHFQGSLADLCEAARSAPLPCLRKDFIVDEFQLMESRAHAADAVLLIASALSDRELEFLHARARDLGLDVLVEVHSESELDRVLGMACEIVGVNSRDLRTFQVDLQTPMRLAARLPESMLRVAESGISSRADLEQLRKAGYDAFLVGECLMRADQPAAALRGLLAAQPSAPVAERRA